MFDRWCTARFRRLTVALVLGGSIAAIGATASATVVLEADSGNGPVRRIADAPATQPSLWPWLLIAALIGLAPLAVERYYRAKASRRRYSRLDITLLETELAELKVLDRRHRAILEALDRLPDGIEISDAEGRQLYSNAKHGEFFPNSGHPHDTAPGETRLADGRTVLIRTAETPSGGSVTLRSDVGGLETARGVRTIDRGASPSADAGHRRSLRILLAEDNDVNQKVACAFLTRAGHVVDTVENGQLAVAAVERCAYDVVLMDIQMPAMDGVAATRAIRRLGGDAAKVPIIALTASAMVGDREKYLSMGADGYISKPIEPNELFGTIGQFCATDSEPPA